MISIKSKDNSVFTELNGTVEEILNDLIRGVTAILIKIVDDKEAYDIVFERFLEDLIDFADQVQANMFLDSQIES
ncbi:MAG: hypothetical protein MR357_00610 [Anaeroplasma sp.]|nr:hypothetical protein [Anaeroplasma sp.]